MGKIIAVLVLVLAIGGAFFWASNTRVNIPSETVFPNPGPSDTNATNTNSSSESVVGQYTPPPVPTVKTFTVDAKNFSFSPASISVKKGDTVKIILKNTEGGHDLVIDEFSARTKIINSGEEDAIQFVADKTGSFEFYCSVMSHREMGMKGTLTVVN